MNCRIPNHGGGALWLALFASVFAFASATAGAQTIVQGNLTVGTSASPGPSPATWYGLATIFWGSASATINGTLTLAFKPNGMICGYQTECTSGYCAQGVCCNATCNDGCDACNLKGSVGTCAAQPSGTVCRAAAGPCGVTSTCNGTALTCTTTTTTTVQAAGTLCLAAQGPCGLDARCDGATVNCPPAYVAAGTVCDPSGATCSGTSAKCTSSSGVGLGGYGETLGCK